ncbi:extracellular solute-binding protein [Thalassospira marina]|uniref:extracellular solute-binding protein n=1 Tax=Thalassospira marina TaxID=2048283 RepID=UPI001561BDE1|nr:extracellular solute-binding protein [Thalassospira marina]
MKLKMCSAIMGASLCALMGAMAAPAHAEGELYFYNWSNYFPQELFDKFEKETGIKVTLDVYDSNETMLAKLQAGASGYDIVVASDYMVDVMIKEKLATEFDAKSLENFKNVAKPHDTMKYDPDRKYSVTYLWGTTGFTYDSDVVGEKLEDSWKEFFEPREELRGKIGALNDEVEMYAAAAYYAGVDKCTEDPKEAQKILDILLKQKPYVAVYSSEGTIDRMAAKEVAMHMQWNGASHRTRESLPSAVFVYPKEGLSFWSDHFVIPSGAPHLDNAKTFINWMMQPENAAAASNYAGYMNGIKGSDAFLDDALKADPAVNMPEEYADRLVPGKNCSAKGRDLRNRVWTKLKS